MISTGVTELPTPRGAAQGQPASGEPRLWGLTARELHDRYWSSRGVQVIRPGRGGQPGTAIDPRGPRLYLLLDADDFVLFKLAPVAKRLAWIKPRIMRVRVVNATAAPYVERVIADDEDRFLRVRRFYRPRSSGAVRVAVTGETRLARAWALGPGGRAGWRELRDTVGRQGVTVYACDGQTLDFTPARPGPDAPDPRLVQLMRAWRDPSAVLDGVYEFQPGVVLHEAAVTEGGVRFVGPVWVGAGVRIDPGQIVIGPRTLRDAPGARASQRPFEWGRVAYPGWRPTPRLRGRLFRLSKRTFDICFASAVLIGTAPIYPITIALIALEDGWPVFFGHRRQTIRGREFPCWKFRTMCKGAESMKAQLAAKNQADGPQFFMEDDPRLLRVGKWLRRFQVDELPQFFNVLLGHMSVVGPRPSPDKENQFCPAWREARLSVRPGVTGLWQVRRTRAPETDFQEWIRYDLEYVQHESWRLDLWIIWRTIVKVFRG